MFNLFKKPEIVPTDDPFDGVIGSGMLPKYETRAAKHLNHIYSTATDSNKADYEIYKTSDLVNKCVSHIAEQASLVKFNVKQLNSKGVLEPVKDKKLERLFSNKPNPQQSWYDIITTHTQSIHLSGNTYITFEKVQGAYEMWAITEPHEVNVTINKDDGLVNGYTFNQNTTYGLNEMLHIKNPVLGNPYYGVSTLRSLIDQLTLEGYATSDIISFYQNGLVSSSILSSEQPLTKKQAETLTSDLKTKYSFKNNRQGLIVLPNNLTVKPLRINPKEAMLLDSLDITEDRILSTFKIHKIILGGSNIQSYPRAMEDIQSLQFGHTVRPLVVKFQRELQQFLRDVLKKPNLVIEIDYSEVPEVQLARVKHAETVRQLYTTGLTTLNESREILGYPVLPDALANENLLPAFLLGNNVSTVQNPQTITPDTLDEDMSSDKLGGKAIGDQKEKKQG